MFHSINLPLFPTYVFKKEEEEVSLVKNSSEELWKQPAEGGSHTVADAAPTLSHETVKFFRERVWESVWAETPEDVTYTPTERALSLEGVYPHAFWAVENSAAHWQEPAFCSRWNESFDKLHVVKSGKDTGF